MTSHLLAAGEILLERYEVVKYLDEGGMQQVYLATDLALGRHVALKTPKSASAEKRFERSARVSARVVHANVAATLDYFDHTPRSYLVEEYIDGVTLADQLENEFVQLDPHLAAHLIHRVAKGVAAAHHAGVHHRDLKPSNIMVSRDPSLSTVKITDFGIAKMAGEEISDAFKDKASTTGSQTVMGALPYMAPEMILDQKNATLPSDIWALGAILYQVLTGDFPFGRGLGAVPAIVNAKLPPKPPMFDIKSQFKPLTDHLWAIVGGCLRRDPGERPKADELVQMCAKLCYSGAPRRVGSIDTFPLNRLRNCGFLRASSSIDSTFFHIDSYYGDKPEVNARVNFADFPGSPRPRAFPVLPLKIKP